MPNMNADDVGVKTGVATDLAVELSTGYALAALLVTTSFLLDAALLFVIVPLAT